MVPNQCGRAHIASMRIEVAPRLASAMASGSNSVWLEVLSSPSQWTNTIPGWPPGAFPVTISPFTVLPVTDVKRNGRTVTPRTGARAGPNDGATGLDAS